MKDLVDIDRLPTLGSFDFQIAQGYKKLKSLKVEKTAWRIMRNYQHTNQSEVSLERLDRFETKLIEAFKPRYLFREE
jgi:hypothetical protein